MGLYENGFNLFMLSGEKIRSWMIASPQMWDGLEWIDMVLKKKRNPDARSLRDVMLEGCE
jgi:hypothetical protein